MPWRMSGRASYAGAEPLWWKLRELKQVGFKFRQQVPIDHFVVDFACVPGRLIVEVDGGTHSTDNERKRDFGSRALLALARFSHCASLEFRRNAEHGSVMDTIVAALHTPIPSPPGGGETILPSDGGQ